MNRLSLPLIATLLLTLAACGSDPVDGTPGDLTPLDMATSSQADMSQIKQDMSVGADMFQPEVDMATPEADMSTSQVDMAQASMDMSTEPFRGITDPMCIDGKYTEELPNQNDISSYISNYDPTQARAFYEGILGTRYPMGAKLVSEAQRNQRDCVELFKGNASDAAEALTRLGTVVHECGHFYDGDNRVGFMDNNHYAINPTLSFQCTLGESVPRRGKTFARSRIVNDEFSKARLPCSQGRGCDFYAPVYLDGNPDDAVFESGDQGYNMLLEEAVQYVNSLATAYAFRDLKVNTSSDRDGILTFLWYLGRYLHLARTQYPEAYAHISNDPCWRQATLTVWGRAWFYLNATEGEMKLGIDDVKLKELATTPVLLEEIERLRNIEGCTP